jgi:transposase
MRQWRALINYRQQLVQRRTRMRNHARDLLQREGVLLPRGRKAWTQVGMAALSQEVKPLSEVSLTDLWRGELGVELAQLQELQQQIQSVEAKLDELGAAHAGVRLLRTIAGVGPRLAEAVVTMFDDPTRFRRAGEVSAYIGMVPKQFDSGETERSGRITKQGNRLVRSLLVEVAWASHQTWAPNPINASMAAEVTQEDHIVAVGKLLARCWACCATRPRGALRSPTLWWLLSRLGEIGSRSRRWDRGNELTNGLQ